MNDKKISVFFDTAGVQRIGIYLRETAYEVEVKEADRLIETKGFKKGSPEKATVKKEA